MTSLAGTSLNFRFINAIFTQNILLDFFSKTYLISKADPLIVFQNLLQLHSSQSQLMANQLCRGKSWVILDYLLSLTIFRFTSALYWFYIQIYTKSYDFSPVPVTPSQSLSLVFIVWITTMAS